MYAKTLSAIAVISAAAVAAQDEAPKVNTPAFVAQCKPVKLTWQGGEPPYHLYVTAPGNIKEVKADLGDQQGTSMTWKVTIPEGQKFTLNLCDKSGQCQQSGQAGPVGSGDDSCLNGGGDKGSKSDGSGGAAAGGGGNSKSDDDSGKSKSGDSSSKSSDSKSSKSSSASKSSGSPSSSSSSAGGDKSSSGSSSQPTSSSSGAAAGDDKDSEKGDDMNSDSKDGEDDKGGNDGAATFSGVPAVVAGVVGIAIAALI